MTYEGTLRQARKRKGEYSDRAMYAILAEEYKGACAPPDNVLKYHSFVTRGNIFENIYGRMLSEQTVRRPDTGQGAAGDSILRRCMSGEYWRLVESDIIHMEVSKNPDSEKRGAVLLLLNCATETVKYNSEIKLRASRFREHGIGLFDSIHLAAAEYAKVDIFLTTDIRLLRAATRTDVKIRVANPLNYYMEVLNNEQLGS
jgi:predicted nucleic acid-binding protein